MPLSLFDSVGVRELRGPFHRGTTLALVRLDACCRYEAWALFRRTILTLLGAVLADQTRSTLLALLCLVFYLVHVAFQVGLNPWTCVSVFCILCVCLCCCGCAACNGSQGFV